MVVRVLVLTAVLAGCPYSNPAQIDAPPGTTTDGGDAAIDSQYDPCTLPDVALVAGTLAGCASSGMADGPRGVAKFDNPVNLVLSPSGIAYVADFDSSRLRKVLPDGKTTTLVADPRLNRPFGIIMTPAGYLYVEADDNDQGQHSPDSGMIWKIDPASGAMSIVIANHRRPRGLALLGDGRIVTSDYIHHVIEIVDPTNGTATALAGTPDVYGHANSADGALATFAQPWDLILDSSGDLIVTEYDNNCLRRVSLTGEVSDFAGTGVPGHKDGPLAEAQFFQPKGITKDASGALYITEAGNHDIRKIANGMVTTIAGKLEEGYHDDNDPLAAVYYGVEGLDVSANGKRIVVADGNNGDLRPFNHVREIRLP
jgi:DNA-binding beta-propeller fold protein YncE